MPRVYTRTTQRGNWLQENVLKAIDALQAGTPLSTASKQFQVPRNTLRRHFDNKNLKAPGETALGKSTVLGSCVEYDLVQYITGLSNRGFGLTPKDIRSLAYEYVVLNNIPNNFDKENQMAGKDWWSGFKNRHSAVLSVRKPEALSLSRAMCMNPVAINSYFDILGSEMKRLDVTNRPGCIYNCDESGLSLVPETQKIVAAKGSSSVYQVTSAERGVLTTVVPCYNAAGDYIPPMVIFKGKRLPENLRAGLPDGTLVAVSDTGYMNKELFELWIKHFHNFRKYRDLPALLVLDGHGSHVKALNALKFAESKNISTECLPPHTTHFTQPQDRSFFKPLKSNFANERRIFLRKNPGRAVTRYDFGKLFSAAYHKTASMQIAVNSFKATGIYPLNRDAIPSTAYTPSETTNRTLPADLHTSAGTGMLLLTYLFLFKSFFNFNAKFTI